jgi:hypothetical protein
MAMHAADEPWQGDDWGDPGAGNGAAGRGDSPQPVVTPLDLWGMTELTGQPELARDMLPPVIADMAIDEAARLGVDPAMLALPALGVCAAAIHDDHRIQPKARDSGWTESCRLWIAIVAPVGGRKTPAISRVVRPLRRVEAAWAEQDRSAHARYDIAMRRYKRAVDEHVRRGDGAPPTEPARPPVRRRIVSDATVEALTDILADAGTSVLAVYDELTAWILSHDCYRPSGNSGRDRSLWLSLYDGGPEVVDRIKRGHVHVPRWAACVLGGIQPGPLRRLMGRITDDGLVQRLIVAYAHEPGVGVDRLPDQAAGRAYDRCIERLAESRAPATPYELDAAAQIERETVATIARHVMVLPTTSDAMRGHLAKWEGIFARLLLTYHLIEHDAATPIISAATAESVSRLMIGYLLPHAARLYAEIGDRQLDHSRWIAGYILTRPQLGRITARDVGRAYRELRGDARAISDAMEALTLAGWVTPIEMGRPGSPLARWQINPAVHVTFAARAATEKARRQRERDRIAAAVGALGLDARDTEEEA